MTSTAQIMHLLEITTEVSLKENKNILVNCYWKKCNPGNTFWQCKADADICWLSLEASNKNGVVENSNFQ